VTSQRSQSPAAITGAQLTHKFDTDNYILGAYSGYIKMDLNVTL